MDEQQYKASILRTAQAVYTESQLINLIRSIKAHKHEGESLDYGVAAAVQATIKVIYATNGFEKSDLIKRLEQAFIDFSNRELKANGG